MSQDYETRYADGDDIRQLKQKQSAHRRVITRQEQYLRTHCKMLLSDIRPSEVYSKIDKLKDLVH